MKPRSLEERIQSFGSPVKMLRSSMSGSHNFPLPPQYSSFLEEQRAWVKSVVLTDMGQHMGSEVFSGPDVKRLFSECCVNSFEGFGRGQAKQFVMVREDGLLIGDGVVVALEDDQYEVMAMPFNGNWLEFQAQQRGYKVKVERDLPTGMNTTGRRFYRYQVHGPLALEVMEKAIGAPMPKTKFFHVAEINIAGTPVRAISHTMTRKPGFELFGPRADGPKILQALREAGRPFGMRETGAISTPTNSYESGWYGLQVPALYSGDSMKPFREWISEYGIEGFASMGGSFFSPNVDDYYVTPFDLNFDHIIKFDHDFIGRAALEKMAQQPPKRRKVWLRWDNEDTGRVITEALMGDGPRPRMLGVPYSTYSTYQNDKVLDGDKQVGMSAMCGYTINVGGWSSLAIIDAAYAKDGQKVEVLWGDAETSMRPLPVEPHVLTKIRATVSTKAFV